ncbi:alpha/beta hydrolase [soil metagenome]
MALSYNTKGKGEAVLWIHGFGFDGTAWDGYADSFADNYLNIIVDLPGFGKSENYQTPTSIDEMAKAVKAVLDKEGIQKVNVVGHSMGGYIALALITLYPGLVTRLVMFHSQPFADDSIKKAARKKVIDFIEKNGLETWMKEFYPALFAEKNQKALAKVVEKFYNQGKQFKQVSVVNATWAMINRPDRSSVLEKYTGPVLFIVGNEDKAIPTDNSLDQLSLPDTSFAEMLDGVAHMGIFESPKETKRAIEELLDYPIS